MALALSTANPQLRRGPWWGHQEQCPWCHADMGPVTFPTATEILMPPNHMLASN